MVLIFNVVGALYEEFIEKVLQEIANYSSNEASDVNLAENLNGNAILDEDFPVVCPDDCKTFTEFDKLENLIDTSDEFLMKAFESFFVRTEKPKSKEKESLYNR